MNSLHNIENLNNEKQKNDEMSFNNIHSLNEEELRQEQNEMRGHGMGYMNKREVEYDLNNHKQLNWYI